VSPLCRMCKDNDTRFLTQSKTNHHPAIGDRLMIHILGQMSIQIIACKPFQFQADTWPAPGCDCSAGDRFGAFAGIPDARIKDIPADTVWWLVGLALEPGSVVPGVVTLEVDHAWTPPAVDLALDDPDDLFHFAPLDIARRYSWCARARDTPSSTPICANVRFPFSRHCRTWS